MLGLLYKNFRIHFSFFLLIVIITLVCSAIAIIVSISVGTEGMIGGNGVLLLFVLYYFAFMLSSLTSNQLFEADENKTASAFAISLPQCGKGHIESKYWYILIQYFITLFITYLTDTVTFGILGGAFSAAMPLVIIFCWRLLLSAIEIPFVIRFGSQKGIAIKGMIITFVIILGILYIMFGDISWLIYSDDPLEALMDWINTGKILFPISLFPFISVAAYWLSCQISIKVFRKGAEGYEQ